MIEKHFHRLYSIMAGSKTILALSQRYDAYFLGFVSVLLQFVDILARVCHICAFLLSNLLRQYALLLINGCCQN